MFLISIVQIFKAKKMCKKSKTFSVYLRYSVLTLFSDMSAPKNLYTNTTCLVTVFSFYRVKTEQSQSHMESIGTDQEYTFTSIRKMYHDFQSSIKPRQSVSARIKCQIGCRKRLCKTNLSIIFWSLFLAVDVCHRRISPCAKCMRVRYRFQVTPRTVPSFD